jgi:Uma2 family endonuclease
MSATLAPPETVGELLARLGDIPAERVLWSPRPGTARERDLLRYLDRDNRLCELIDGTLVEKPMGQRESSLAVWLIVFIGQYLEQHPIGQVYGADGPFRLRRGRVRFPDVAYASWDRIPDGPEDEKPISSWPPDLAVEVLSAGNTRQEMKTKLEEYLAAGVKLVWIMDLKSKTVRVYRPESAPQKLTERDTLTGDDILPGFRLSLKTLFGKVEGNTRR